MRHSVSVITTFTVDRHPYISQLVASLEPLTHFFHSRWVAIVVPDAPPRLSIGAAWNDAVQLINRSTPTSWRVLLDSDNVVHPKFAQAAAQSIRENPGVDLILAHQFIRAERGGWRVNRPNADSGGSFCAMLFEILNRCQSP